MKRSILIIAILVLAVAAILLTKHLTTKPPDASATAAEGPPGKPLPGLALSASLRSGRPTMADFGAGTCQVCKELQPTIDAAAADYAGKANVVYVDTGLYPDIARQYDVRLIPTQIFFDADGSLVSRNVGKISPEEIARRFADLGVEQ